MEQINDFADDRQKTWCIHCGHGLAEQDNNRDHVPTKKLLREPYPDNLPVVQVCKSCNSGFSMDEEYFIAFLSSVLSGSTDPQSQRIPSAALILKRNNMLSARIHESRSEGLPLVGDVGFVWQPESERIERVVLKNARGHAYFELGEPMLCPPRLIRAIPLATISDDERLEFENVDSGPLFPEVGSRMLTRIVTGQDIEDGWVIVQEDVYRYAVMWDGGITVRTVLYDYLATEVRWDA